MGVFKRVITRKDGTRVAYWYSRNQVDGRDRWKQIGKVG